jgi:hypothetical protein
MPRTRYYQLEFARKLLGAKIPTHEVSPPTKHGDLGVFDSPEQAVACEPELLLRLEVIADRLYEAGDKRLGAVLAAIVQAVACMRFAHLQRCQLIGRTASALHALGYRGKSSEDEGKRTKFRVRIPRHTLSRFCPLDLLWNLWNKLCIERNHIVTGLACNFSDGTVLTYNTYQQYLRSVLGDFKLIEQPGVISSYSLRRFLPTLCDIRGKHCSVSERFHTGAWSAKGVTDARTPSTWMPMRYADRKLDSEEFSKIMNIELLRIVVGKSQSQHITWEVVRKHMDHDHHNDASCATTKLMEATAGSRIEEAFGAADEIAKYKQRTLSYPPRSFSVGDVSRGSVQAVVKQEQADAVSDAPGISGVVCVDDEHFSSDDNLSTDEEVVQAAKPEDPLPIAWMYTSKPGSRVHFVDDDGEPLCIAIRSGKVVLGRGVLSIPATGRQACKQCIRKLGEVERLVYLSVA